MPPRPSARRPAVLAALALVLGGCLPSVTWLPDGKRIAYVQGGAVWLVNLAGQRTHLFTAAGETPWFVSAAPMQDRLAVVSAGAGYSRLTIVDSAGTVEWSVTAPGGGQGRDEGPAIVFPANPWGPRGMRLLVVMGPTTAVVDLSARTITPAAEAAVDARFSPAGELLLLTGTRSGALQLTRVDRAGHRDPPIRWKAPPGTPEDARPRLAFLEAASATRAGPEGTGPAVWFSQSGSAAREVLATRDGRVLFSSARGIESYGPDDAAYLTKDGGWALVRVGGPVTNLAALYGKVAEAEANWLKEGDAAAPAAEPAFNSLAAWSPDHRQVAVLTAHLLVVAEPATGTVTALAKW